MPEPTAFTGAPQPPEPFGHPAVAKLIFQSSEYKAGYDDRTPADEPATSDRTDDVEAMPPRKATDVSREPLAQRAQQWATDRDRATD